MSSERQTTAADDGWDPIPIQIGTVPGARAASSRRDEPITVGVPLPRGFARIAGGLALVGDDGARRALQTTVLDRWSDGSIRWALLDFRASADTGVPTIYLLRPSPSDRPPPVLESAVTLRWRGASLVVETGAASFVLREGGRFPFHQVTVAGASAIDARHSELEVFTTAAKRCYVQLQRLVVEHQGPLRAVVRIEGAIRPPGSPSLLQLFGRLHFFAGLSDVRVSLTLRNPRQARHRGGLWDLGDPGSVFVRDVSVRMVLPDSPEPVTTLCSTMSGEPLAPVPSSFELYQDSSGGANWKSSNHVNRHGVVPHAFRGYRLSGPGREQRGLRATPVATVSRGNYTIAMGMEYFWQNFPKALSSNGGELRLSLFPGEFSDVHEIQAGEQKTHVFMVAFGPDRVSAGSFDWWREPLSARLTPEAYAMSCAVPYLVPAALDPNTTYVQLVQEAVEGEDSFEQKREVIDECGWRHFGDLYGDHEAARQTSGPPLVSHYNNQYDPVSGFAVQFMRTGDHRWWRLMSELAAHVVDIDIYHTVRDKAAYNHGLFWHTCHYTDAGRATHRSYPSGADVPGGGPSAEHNYANGLMLHYFMTGDEASREAAIGLAQFAIDIDDGRKNPLRWVYQGATGLASASGAFTYHGPGRGAANSVEALMTGYRLTGEARFITKAQQLIRRCVHPAEDIERHNLLDTERKWFYTMFLQAIGRYLDDKIERGDLDEMYAYARASLLHYARWMAQHEYPYLQKPEKLQYPTETWAAQDMRKSEVFKYAMKHARGEERARFWERAEFFFRYATETLAQMPTRTRTRPLVLLLSFGFMHAAFMRSPSIAAPEPRWTGAFPEPELFVPQKMAVKRRAIVIGWLALSLVLALAASLT